MPDIGQDTVQGARETIVRPDTISTIKSPGGGEGGGRGDRDGKYMLIHGWFMSVYGKNHYNTVK